MPLLLILYDSKRQTIIISIKEFTITQVGSCITPSVFPVPQTSSRPKLTIPNNNSTKETTISNRNSVQYNFIISKLNFEMSQ